MTPDATLRALTARHAEIVETLDAAFAGRGPLDDAVASIERHRMAIHLSALWLLSETGSHRELQRTYDESTKRLQARMHTLGTLRLRGRSMHAETRRILDAWLTCVHDLVDVAARETTNAGRELLVRAYQRADQLAGKRTVNTVPAELD